MMRFLLLFIFFSNILSAQMSHSGNLPIKNYSKKTYQGGTQNWDVAVAPNGVMYFANNEGLLEFDGVYWKKYPISNRTIVRSLAISNEKIYVGGQGELGYFGAKSNGSLEYYTLRNTIPEEYLNFGDVWDVLITENNVLFRTERYVFCYSDEKMQVFNTGGPIHFIGKINGDVYVHDEYKGLLKFTGESFLLSEFSHKPSSPVTSFLPYSQDTFLVTTLNDGLYLFDEKDLTPFQTPLDEVFRTKNIYSACALKNGGYAFGITPDGLLLTDKNFRLTRRLGKKEGLQNSNVLSLNTDLTDNLWLGLDNGIDYVEVNSAYTYLYPDGNLEGTGYTATVFKEKLYLGNSNGLYVKNWKNGDSPSSENNFKRVPGTDGQVWGLQVLDDELFVGHHNGTFNVIGNQVEKITDLKGSWNFLKPDENHLVIGHYQGISLYKKEADKWKLYEKIKGLNESSRLLALENEKVIWMAHPYRGVYRIVLQEDFKTESVTKYDSENGLPSDNFNNVFKVRNEVVFAGESGIYSFDEETETFELIESYSAIFRDYGRVKMLKEDEEGNIWFMAGETCGRLRIEDDGLDIKLETDIYPELSRQMVGGFEFVYPYNKENIFFGAEKGFIRFDAKKYAETDFTINVKIAELRLKNEIDSLLFCGGSMVTDKNSIELSHKENTLSISYSADAYRHPDEVQFQTRMMGLSDKWSDWTGKTEKEFTSLSHGSYTFEVRARSAAGTVSEPEKISFKIRPPWYLTSVAYALYGLILLSGIFFSVQRQNRKFEQEKDSLKSQHEKKEEVFRKKAEERELELSRVKRQQLETEVEFKNQELASATLHLVQKREMLAGLKTDLSKLLSKMRQKEARPQDLQKLIRLVERDLENDSEWDQFAHHFDQVHQGFLTRLKEKYPVLSPNDLKLCAYLRMNLSSKEIAPMMAISVRGVEAGRYRLRKKISLPNDANLREVMMNV